MPQPPWTTLVSVDALAAAPEQRPETLLLLDTRADLRDRHAGLAAYTAGHLPGAFHLDLESDLSGPKTGSNGRHPLPDRAALAARLAALGLHSAQQVVLYDASGGMFAARGWWLLQWLGHRAVAVLDGGLPAWVAAGQPLQTEAPLPVAGDFVAGPSLVGTIDHTTLRSRLAQGSVGIVDARAPDRFRGENETLDPVGGHIPGALNRCFQDNLLDGRFKPPVRLREEWAPLLAGRAPQALVHQCGSGVTACHNLLALAHAGLPGGQLYPGSWSEWCAQPGAPVECG